MLETELLSYTAALSGKTPEGIDIVSLLPLAIAAFLVVGIGVIVVRAMQRPNNYRTDGNLPQFYADQQTYGKYMGGYQDNH